jgi:malate dehydrogenase (oxaloacetate-decarboxylating)(NADP+)
MESFAADTPCRTLPEIMDGADVFVGVSAGGIVSRDMIRRMNPRPVVFALANPIPEIGYHDTRKAVPDAIVATGRSDFPNQVNNVLAFPGIFRGALDVEAAAINEAMKRAAAHALAELARKAVPRSVSAVYGGRPLKFGPGCILPKPLDPRVVWTVAAAVAKAAMESGVAGKPLADMEKYIRTLKTRLSRGAKGRP